MRSSLTGWLKANTGCRRLVMIQLISYFLYRGDPFDNASVGRFIRVVDRIIPDWRELFEVEFGAYPGLDCFNPDKRQPGMVN